jgi:hypothetical protein
MKSFLPPRFHSTGGKGSYSDLIEWLAHEPITTPNKSLASYQTVEIVALSIGLAMRDLEAIQFKDDSVLPAHVVNSPLQFRMYETLTHCTEDLIRGWEDMWVPKLTVGSYSSLEYSIPPNTTLSTTRPAVPESTEKHPGNRKKGR